MYNLNVNRIIKLLLPPALRIGKNIDFLLIPFRLIATLISEIKQLRDSNIYYSQFNSQTIVLQHLLNDIFDNQLRRIYIINLSNIFYPYLYNKNEQRNPIYLYRKHENIPLFIKHSSEYYSLTDFKVLIPTNLSVNIDLMKHYIEYYKLAGKKYQIQTY